MEGMRQRFQIFGFGVLTGLIIGLMLSVTLGPVLPRATVAPPIVKEQCAEGIFLMPRTGLSVSKVLVCAKEPRLIWPDVGPQPPVILDETDEMRDAFK